MDCSNIQKKRLLISFTKASTRLSLNRNTWARGRWSWFAATRTRHESVLESWRARPESAIRAQGAGSSTTLRWSHISCAVVEEQLSQQLFGKYLTQPEIASTTN